VTDYIKSLRLPDGRTVEVQSWRDGFIAFEGALGPAIGSYDLQRCASAYSDYAEFVVQGLQIRGLQKTPLRPEHATVHVNEFTFAAANCCEPVRHSFWAETADGRLLKVREREELPGLTFPMYWKEPKKLHVYVEHRDRIEPYLAVDWSVVVLLTGAMRMKHHTPPPQESPKS
jgi:hypothetical protein